MDVTDHAPEIKDWGVTRTLRDGPTLIFHATVEAGGYCSRHYHKTRVNFFYVISGKIKVVVYPSAKSTEPCRTYVLRPNDSLALRPGIVHRFEAVEKTELLEVYWGELDAQDIVRSDKGGMMPALVADDPIQAVVNDQTWTDADA